ncbi:MAG: CapA family protein [Acetobacter sp.]|jgi:poly-gamma-glutamate synthesis protein (capsule biosynthesis protein)|nr:CapA family protein [Acetobacter sp.]MCH4062471.1 CapA family protein [Acetobacter sp.]MCH4088682.1 CapA family protein [Acetobacter sp.]MCI1292587.1 CapA family protein [Acetobacter sp.]MCI1319313.1 CapA family protein [Acetobacter sp.]
MRLALTGDSILFRRLNSQKDETISPLFDLIRECDVGFTNLEFVANDFEGDPALDHGGTHFGAPCWVLDELNDAGFNLYAAATNHSLDYSISGLRKMMQALDEREMVYAGIGANLEEARRPAYTTTPAGTVSLLSCTSTFARGQEASAQTGLMAGRPGVNPLHFNKTYQVTSEEASQLRSIYERLGLQDILDEKVRQGFSFYPPKGTLPFDGLQFITGEQTRVQTQLNQKDLSEIVKWVEEAKLVSDVVVVSIHAHESDYNADGIPDIEVPAAFLRDFTHAVIDAGASVVVCHGPHLLRGVEIYKNTPIFHGLGNFIGQNELVSRLPMDSYTAFRYTPDMTPHKLYKGRSENDTKGFPSDQRFWDSMLPVCHFEDGVLKSVDIHPVTLGLGLAAHKRGVPYLAKGADNIRIQEKIRDLSKPFETSFGKEDGYMTLRFDQ